MIKQSDKLSDEQLVLQAKNGNTDALAQLITRLLPLIKHIAGFYSSVGLEHDDFVQEGLIGLFTAVKNYDAEKASFHTYATLCIRSRMLGCVAELLQQKHLPLSNYLPIEELGFLEQDSGDPLELYLKQEEQTLRQEKIKTLLSESEQHTLTLYLSGYSYEEMANILCCTPKAVDNALQRVRKKLRND